MALFGKRGKDAAEDWTPVAIHILKSVRLADHREGSTDLVSSVIDMAFEGGGEPYAFTLEVRPPGGEAYQIEHQEKVRNRVASPGLFRNDKIPAGVDLAGWVKVDDFTKVKIDWTSYRASPEATAAIEDASVAEADLGYAEHILAKQKPAVQAQLRAAAWGSTSGLAPMVRAGAVSREDWEREALSNLRKTLITPEQYAEALAIVEG
jgi:hypothetical protein